MLSQQQIEDRKRGIGGSDSTRIMTGDWQSVWEEKTGRKEPDDLSKNIAVQIGIATEKVNLDFLGYELNETIIRDVDVNSTGVHPDWLMSHLDGMTLDKKIPIECKHTYHGNRFDVLAERNYWQMQHYMMHTGATWMYLSAIFGNNKWEHGVIDSDMGDQQRLFKVLSYIWECVVNDEQPIDVELPVTPKPDDIAINGLKSIDLSKDDEFLEQVKLYKATKPFVIQHNEHKDNLKSRLDKTRHRKVYGAGISISLNKRGIISLKEDKDE